jgi:hypothetical protein
MYEIKKGDILIWKFRLKAPYREVFSNCKKETQSADISNGWYFYNSSWYIRLQRSAPFAGHPSKVDTASD